MPLDILDHTPMAATSASTPLHSSTLSPRKRSTPLPISPPSPKKRRFAESTDTASTPPPSPSSLNVSHLSPSLVSDQHSITIAVPQVQTLSPLTRSLSIVTLHHDIDMEQDLKSPAKARSPSPVPTEVVSEEELPKKDPEAIHRELIEQKIKIRDFAWEPNPAVIVPFNPVRALVDHDWHLRNVNQHKLKVSHQGLWRLLRMGWITLSEVEPFWSTDLRQNVLQFDSQEDGPIPVEWVNSSSSDTIPTPQERVWLRKRRYPTTLGDLPDSQFFGSEPYVTTKQPAGSALQCQKTEIVLDLDN